MNCSPLMHERPTTIPPRIRRWIGHRLSGPPGGTRHRRYRACLFALGRIGDFVLTLGALRRLIREFGLDDCVLVMPASMTPVVHREFPGLRTITLPTDAPGLVRDIIPIWWRDRRRFAADRFEQRICLCHQRGLYYELALSWIDADHDVRLLPATYPAIRADGLCTELLAHWRLVETVLGRPVPREEILPGFTGLPTGDDRRLLIYPLSLEPERSLPAATTTIVLRHWRECSHAQIVFGGRPADRAQLEHYAEAARRAGLADVGVETPHGIDGLLRHVAQAGAVLSCDSAAGHIATALDKPGVVITTPGFFGYCQPWTRSGRQQVFLDDAPAGAVAAALPAL